MKKIPTFAVAGDPNVGKSTLIATLAEEDSVEISRRAGTTRQATPYTATVDGKPILRFIDLPGFENTPQLKAWLAKHSNETGNLGNAFVAEFRNDPRFQAEREILQAIDGAAVIFVVDATRPVEPRDRDQAEILRLCTDKRMAIINVRSDRESNRKDAQTLEEWKSLLGKHFTYHCFDPLHANFQDRIELLEAVSHVMPGWRDLMKEAIQLFQDDWQQRRMPEIVCELCELLENLIKFRARAPLSKGRTNAENAAKQKVETKVRKLEEEFRKKVLFLFQHKRGEWEMPTNDILGEDIFSERVWKLFGLTKKQLIWSATIMGAVVGAGIDLMAGGFLFGLGTLIGGTAGVVGGYLAAGKAVESSLATDHVEASVSPKSNLLWIVMDRALLFVEAAANWSHGRRDTPRGPDDTKIGPTSGWSETDRKSLIQWIGALSSQKFNVEKTQQYEQDVRNLILRELAKLTASAS